MAIQVESIMPAEVHASEKNEVYASLDGEDFPSLGQSVPLYVVIHPHYTVLRALLCSSSQTSCLE